MGLAGSQIAAYAERTLVDSAAHLRLPVQVQCKMPTDASLMHLCSNHLSQGRTGNFPSSPSDQAMLVFAKNPVNQVMPGVKP